MNPPEEVRVYVLSSDERIREAAGALSSRYSVTFSSDKRQALKEISRNAEVAVIELDLCGFGVTKEIRERTPDRHVRVVMLCSRPHDRWLCKQAGADEVLVKPLSDVSLLVNAVTG